MKKDIKNKLKSYSVAAGAVISAGQTTGAVVYTDVNPDQTFTSSSSFYNLDLNNDNTTDFTINLYKSNFTFTSFTFTSFMVYASPLNTNEIAASSSYYALALAANTQIGNSLSWSNTSSQLMALTFQFNTPSSTFSSSYGNWINATDKYLGLRLRVATNTHYGWARLDVNTNNGSFTIKDYAYDDANNTSILAGQLPSADLATNIVATDVDDNADGSDLRVSFDMAANEATVSEYRIMVVKNGSSSGFDLNAAQAITSANYTVVAPNGSNVSMTLASTANDVDGDPIELGQPYKVFVLSKPDGVIRTLDGLSMGSNVEILNTTAGVATNLSGADIADNHHGADFEVSFQRAPDESRIVEYRIIVMQESDTSGFDLAAAQAVVLGNYTAISPNGNHIQQPLGSAAKDKNGIVLKEDTSYVFYVLSIADGTNANIDSLSAKSPSVALKNTIGIDDQNALKISAYTHGSSLFLDFGTSTNRAEMRIYDLNGRIVHSQAILDRHREVRLEHLHGVFVLQLNVDGKQHTQKIQLN